MFSSAILIADAPVTGATATITVTSIIGILVSGMTVLYRDTAKRTEAQLREGRELYAQILADKDAQIQALNEEIARLRMEKPVNRSEL